MIEVKRTDHDILDEYVTGKYSIVIQCPCNVNDILKYMQEKLQRGLKDIQIEDVFSTETKEYYKLVSCN